MCTETTKNSKHNELNISSGSSRFSGSQILVKVTFKPNFDLNVKIEKEFKFVVRCAIW